MQIYPIAYSIPDELCEKKTNAEQKTSEIAPLIPGVISTYIYSDEDSYYKMYQSSKYAITHKKYGWDCLRHYEILMNQCIPEFKDLEKCPEWTMHTFPKKQLLEIANIRKNRQLTDEEYTYKLNELSEYCAEHLTCSQSAKYVLKILCPDINFDILPLKKPNILFLSGTVGYRNVNYSRELLALGMSTILGNTFVDTPKINVLYKGCKNLHKYIGRGFTYGGRLIDSEIDRTNIEERILKKEFDAVIYGKVGNKRGEIEPLENLPFWKSVQEKYTADKIAFLYGGDLCRNIKTDIDLQLHSKYGICFVREGF